VHQEYFLRRVQLWEESVQWTSLTYICKERRATFLWVLSLHLEVLRILDQSTLHSMIAVDGWRLFPRERLQKRMTNMKEITRKK